MQDSSAALEAPFVAQHGVEVELHVDEGQRARDARARRPPCPRRRGVATKQWGGEGEITGNSGNDEKTEEERGEGPVRRMRRSRRRRKMMRRRMRRRRAMRAMMIPLSPTSAGTRAYAPDGARAGQPTLKIEPRPRGDEEDPRPNDDGDGAQRQTEAEPARRRGTPPPRAPHQATRVGRALTGWRKPLR